MDYQCQQIQQNSIKYIYNPFLFLLPFYLFVLKRKLCCRESRHIYVCVCVCVCVCVYTHTTTWGGGFEPWFSL